MYEHNMNGLLKYLGFLEIQQSQHRKTSARTFYF